MKIAIIGLGYVGIQLATGLGRQYATMGFDLDAAKVAAYEAGEDPTGEASNAQLADAIHLGFTTEPDDLRGYDVYIVAVPTPVDAARHPNLGPLISASRAVGQVMSAGAIVVYESTVYPGATEEICVPELESVSGLTWKKDFHVGYSPERINPGDPEHTLATIVKIVSADDDETLETLAGLYGAIVSAGIHRAPSIRVAEAAKVIENTQRDLNIALVNELAVLFDRLDINTQDVLNAAGSKWNFLPFQPGLVGGHCIGVDPYYLTHKAEMVGYHPEVILSGRRINDSMAHFVATKTVKLMSKMGIKVAGTRANVFGVTFKENCPDIRNSQVFSLIRELEGFGLEVSVVDPRADVSALTDEYGVQLTPIDKVVSAPVTILAVPHQEFCQMGFAWLQSVMDKPGLLIDIKSVFREQALGDEELTYWSL
jgi:UDP-N-acetyl-D-glucosamine/UDP-N-acetyl-D-galactosamine dehydrogenase